MKHLSEKQKLLLSRFKENINDTKLSNIFKNIDDYKGEFVTDELFRLTINNEIDDGTTHSFPVEGKYIDRDGEPVFVWLFYSSNNKLAEVEFWKASGESLVADPFDMSLEISEIKEGQIN